MANQSKSITVNVQCHYVQSWHQPFVPDLIMFLLLSLMMSTALYGQVPVNPNATQKTKEVLSYIYNLKGNGVITGQHNYSYDWFSDSELGIKGSTRVNTRTGEWPGLWGSDFVFTDVNRTIEQLQSGRQKMINRAIEQWQAGSIITLSYHMVNPKLEENGGWSGGVKLPMSQAEYLELITPGTTLHTNWKRNMDRISEGLQQLENAGVPVLWRPYHEMNTKFFWWGNPRGTDYYKRLWIMTYDYLVTTKGLNNLIWVFSPNHWSSWNSTSAWDPTGEFPGINYVDIVALDDYYWEQSKILSQGDYDVLKGLAQGKPMAIAEGFSYLLQLPNMDWLMQNRPEFRYFMVWDDFCDSNTTDRSECFIDNLYRDSYTGQRQSLIDAYTNAKAINRGDIVLGGSGGGGTTNLVKNPGFESNLTDWSVTSGTAVIDASNAQSGINAIKVGTTSWSWIQQNITGWTAGGTYTFSAWGRASASGNAVRVALKGSTGDIHQFEFTSTSYAQQTASVTIPSGSTFVQVYVTNKATGGGYADNISVSSGSSSNPPSAPGNLAASVSSSSQINLSWADNSSNETGFELERKTGSAGTWSKIATLGANVTSYQNTGLSASTNYYYRVRAYNSHGNSSYSSEANATTSGSSTSSNLVQNPGFENNLTSWTVASGTAVIDASNSQSGTNAIKVGTTSWSWVQQNLTGWTVGATYSFSAWGKASASGNMVRVALKGSGGDIHQLEFTSTTYAQQTASVTVPAGTTSLQVYITNATTGGGYADNISVLSSTSSNPPSAPSSLSVTTISSSQINLSWTDNSSNETGFKVERKAGSTGTWSEIATPGANATTYQSAGLTAATQYYYRVRAYNNDGNSAYTSEAQTSTLGNNLVLNPGFESNLTNWTVTSGTAVIDAANAQSGTNAIKVGTTSWSWVQQNLSGWTAGSTYLFKAWGKASASGNTVRVALKGSGGDIHQLEFTSTSYTEQSVTVTIPSATTSLQVYVTNKTTGGGYADQISLASTSGTNLSARKKIEEYNPSLEKTMAVYPNPSKGTLSVTYESAIKQNLNLQIIDSQGKIIQSEGLQADEGRNTYLIEVTKRQPGLYMLRLVTKDFHQPISTKVIME